MIRGSCYNGFAPRDGMPMYPSLWQGCVGAWAPCLGPTGSSLRDWSGFANHAAITGATLSTAWLVSNGAYSFYSTGGFSPVAASQFNWAAGDFTLSCWVFPVTYTSGFTALVDKSSGTNREFSVFFTSAGGQVSFVEIGGSSDAVTRALDMVTGRWHCFAMRRRGSTTTYFRDGISRASSTSLTGTTARAGSTINWGGNGSGGGTNSNVYFDDMRFYNRALQDNEIQLLASRRGIAYDLAPFRMPYSEQVAGGFQAAWALRQRLILGGGGGLG